MDRYAFEVDPDSQTLTNRRVFAYVDIGIQNGIQIDKNKNVYASCGDGVQMRVSFSYLPFDLSFSLSTSLNSYLHASFFDSFLFFHPFVTPIRLLMYVLTETQMWNSQG